MRVAYCSPLPPAPSGIADYSAELLPALAAHCEIDLFTAGGRRVDEALAGRFAIHRVDELASADGRSGYDVVLYQLGNDPRYHGEIYRTLLARSGVVVLHEYVLHHMLRELTLAAGDAAGYVEELRYAAGRSGEASGRRAVTTGVPLDPWRYPLFERAVDSALAVIVHNETTRRRVLLSRPEARVRVVPHHLSLDAGLGGGAGDDGTAETATSARASLGLPAGVPIVATFGFLTGPKRLGAALRAFARLRREVPDALFLLAGEAAPGAGVDELLASGLGAGVRRLGRLGRAEFLTAMRAVDVAVNLRYPTAGETSGTLMRLLGLGKAVIVSDEGPFAEIPDGCCAKVAPDESEEELLGAILLRLVADPELRREMGDNARRHMAAHHTLVGSARAYAEILSEIAAVGHGAEPPPAPPPLAPYPREDLTTALLADLAAETTDLGIADADTDGDLLAGLAAGVVDLDIA